MEIYLTATKFVAWLGIGLWALVLCFYMFIRINKKYFLPRSIDKEWIEKWEMDTEHPIAAHIDVLKKSAGKLGKFANFPWVFNVFLILSSLVSFLLGRPYNQIILNLFIVTGLCVPMWLYFLLLIRWINDRKERIENCLKEI